MGDRTRRLFVAIDLTEDVKHILLGAQKQIMGLHAAEGKYPKPEHLHLTLKFLGSVEETQVSQVVERLNQIQFEPLELKLGQIGNFPHVVWVGISGDGLQKLAQDIEVALFDLVPASEHPFHPHITLMRITRCRDTDKFIDALNHIAMAEKSFPVVDFALFNSELTPNGPVHTVIKRFSA